MSSDAALIFNSKQLEELESLHDATGAFEEESEDAGLDDVGEGAMEWRRGLIEEAAENVKRARTRPVDPSITYEIGSLLFDRESRRFGRVNRSVPGYLRIVYLTGGDREYGLLDVASYLKEFAATKKVSELAAQLGMSESDVESELDRLGLSALEEAEDDAQKADDEEAIADPLEEELKAQAVAELQKAEAEAAPTKDKPAKKAKQGAKAKAGGAKKASPKKAKEGASKAAKPAAKKGGRKANPIDDPNEFIRQNFQEMSNRELARHTGLSEHTIRRKLGEWGLKRKK